MNAEQEESNQAQSFGDSDFLAMDDKAIRNFRENENDAKRKIVKKMLTLRHNMKYNKHLLSVYMKAKELFDKMVDEHRSQLHSLDEIYRHLNHVIRENMSKIRIDSKKSVSSNMMTELIKDKKRIGLLLKKMRNSYDKLMNIDTILGVTVDKVNEITFMDDDEENDIDVDLESVESDDGDDGEEGDTGEDSDEDSEQASDEEGEDSEQASDEEGDEDSEEASDEEDEEEDEEESDEEDEEASDEEDEEASDEDEESEEESEEESDEEDDEESEDDEDGEYDEESEEDNPNRDLNYYVF